MRQDRRGGEVTDRDIVHLIELVDQRPHDRDVDAHIAQLLEGEVVLHDGDDVSPYAVDVGIDGQVRVRVASAREQRLALGLMVESPSSRKQRPPFGILELHPRSRPVRPIVLAAAAAASVHGCCCFLIGLPPFRLWTAKPASLRANALAAVVSLRRAVLISRSSGVLRNSSR